MKPVVQEERTGCGIASVAAIAGSILCAREGRGRVVGHLRSGSKTVVGDCLRAAFTRAVRYSCRAGDEAVSFLVGSARLRVAGYQVACGRGPALLALGRVRARKGAAVCFGFQGGFEYSCAHRFRAYETGVVPSRHASPVVLDLFVCPAPALSTRAFASIRSQKTVRKMPSIRSAHPCSKCPWPQESHL